MGGRYGASDDGSSEYQSRQPMDDDRAILSDSADFSHTSALPIRRSPHVVDDFQIEDP